MIYVKNDCLNPYFNLALEEYLFEHGDDNELYFWFWQNDRTIVIGKNQNAYNEIDLDYVRQNGIKLARRMTGGGAVYHDLGNLNFTFVMSSSGQKSYDFKKFTDPIAKALLTFGVKAEYSGRNDLLIDGRKFSGNAQYVGKNKTIHHGTLMFSSDLDVVEKCLTPSKDKLKSHGVSSTKSRVTTIDAHMNEKIDLALFKEQLIGCIFDEYKEVSILELSENDIAMVKQLRDTKYATENWILGASPGFNYSKAKRFESCGTIHVSMKIESESIEYCKITGDFFGSGDPADIEKLLQNVGYDKAQVKNALHSVDIGYYFNHLTLEQLIEVILG